ncbi:MAG: DNA repair protein RecN [Acidimicrobiia bacterium]|nr:MAG: DNA repair protein RecN [Acidimicrobiia bacterium]
MLDEIHAANLGLIDEAVVTPGPALTVITGETGAGKTLMFGALRLVRGETASSDMVGPHADTAEVTARMIDDTGSETVVRRIVTQGRSRAYANGKPVTAGELSETVGPLVSIVSQHDQHTLTTSEGVRKMVDAMLTPTQQPILIAYRRAYESLVSVEAEMDLLGSDHRGLERELEMLRFQISEITAAGFSPGDEEDLRLQLDRMRHVEEISSQTASALAALGDAGAETVVGGALAALERVARLDPEVAGILAGLSDAAAGLREVTSVLTRYADSLEADPVRLAQAEARLAELSALERKYGDTVADIEAFAKDAVARSEAISERLDAAANIQERHAQATESVRTAASALRTARTAHADRAAPRAEQHLKDLGFTDPVVTIALEQKEPTTTGADRFRVLFASDSALKPGPISSVASGGELSRLVLALILASGGAESSVVAFDEIDTGIGGSTALAMGQKLAELAHTRQVICVTHLPQVAAFGSVHYTVERNGTRTTIEEVTGDRRLEEIARMLAGLSESEKGKEHAQELLALALDASR